MSTDPAGSRTRRWPEGDPPQKIHTRGRPGSDHGVDWPRELPPSTVQDRILETVMHNPVLFGSLWGVVSIDPTIATVNGEKDPSEDMLYDLVAARAQVTCVAEELRLQIPWPADREAYYSRALSRLLVLEEALAAAMQAAVEVHQAIHGRE